ncbi:hypothetical protein Sros01_42970 [Streptomyces roseochromogenus]|nr:hypothetical protein Sros01_42970 [Streptomyces roseochromogenus]
MTPLRAIVSLYARAAALSFALTVRGPQPAVARSLLTRVSTVDSASPLTVPEPDPEPEPEPEPEEPPEPVPFVEVEPWAGLAGRPTPEVSGALSGRVASSSGAAAPFASPGPGCVPGVPDGLALADALALVLGLALTLADAGAAGSAPVVSVAAFDDPVPDPAAPAACRSVRSPPPESATATPTATTAAAAVTDSTMRVRDAFFRRASARDGVSGVRLRLMPVTPHWSGDGK